MLSYPDVFLAHEGDQSVGDLDAAIGLLPMLNHRRPDSRGGHGGAVQSVDELRLTGSPAEANVASAGLEIAELADGRHFQPLVDAGRVDLQVHHAGGGESEVAAAKQIGALMGQKDMAGAEKMKADVVVRKAQVVEIEAELEKRK